MTGRSLDLLRGSLDAMILKILSWGPMHGLAIARCLRQVSDGAFQLEEGSLYPALYRMENREWIRAEWQVTENNRRAKYYELTAAGRKQLRAEVSKWNDFAQAVAKVFATDRAPAESSR